RRPEGRRRRQPDEPPGRPAPQPSRRGRRRRAGGGMRSGPARFFRPPACPWEEVVRLARTRAAQAERAALEARPIWTHGGAPRVLRDSQTNSSEERASELAGAVGAERGARPARPRRTAGERFEGPRDGPGDAWRDRDAPPHAVPVRDIASCFADPFPTPA